MEAQAIILKVPLFRLFLLHPYTAVMIPVQIPGSNVNTQIFFAWMHLAALIILILGSRMPVGDFADPSF